MKPNLESVHKELFFSRSRTVLRIVGLGAVLGWLPFHLGAQTAPLLNVNFAAYDRVKVGFAATGQTTNDFWNNYTAPFQAFAGLSNLKLADGTVTAVGLTVQNGAGHTAFSHPDLMYQCCCYAQDLGDITLTVTNLPSGQYDFYVYGHAGDSTANSIFQMLVGGVDFGNKSTATDSSWSLTNWVEGAQYVVYRSVQVTNAGAPLIIKSHPGRNGYTYLNGIQIAGSGFTDPAIISQPVSQSAFKGDNVTFTVSAVGTQPLGYQWRFNGTNILGATRSTLPLTFVQLADAGAYSVQVSNSVSTINSVDAILTVNPIPRVTLLNVNFAAYDRVKVGFAATGQTTNDFWNNYTAPFQAFAGLSNLKLADGTVTAVGLTVQNGAGHTAFSHPDLMYQCCCYAQDLGDITLTVTNLPSGQYDFYVYGHAGDSTANSIFQMLVGGVDFGNKSTATDSSWSLTNWVEGAQYVVYRSVQVTNAGAPLIIKSHPGRNGYTYLNGLQVVGVVVSNCTDAPSGLVSWWKAESNALDAAGSNTGTLIGNTTYGAGRVGQAFVFDGSGDAVSVGNPANLQLQDFTIEAWVKRGSSSVASLTPWQSGGVFDY